MPLDLNSLTANPSASLAPLATYQELNELVRSLRPGQQSLANWQGGQMAVSAVPGAGKSHSLAVAAALAIARYRLHPRRQLMIVTYTRSAAASIKAKVRDRLQALRLPAGGFAVQTLHGLALNIASRHAELSRLDLDTATLVTPNTSHRLVRTCVEQWVKATPQRYQTLLAGVQFDGEETERLRRQSVLRTEVLPSLLHTVVREAKSSGLRPEDLWELSHQTTDEYQILAIAAGLYEHYQTLMSARSLIDYDEMILAALRVLENAPVRQLWQKQVFAVFEDEAQDSSPLQEQLISILARDPEGLAPPNLVRVGDPNQAINSTFTPADPIYFNWFCDLCEQQGNLATMDQAGRSSQTIIDAANFALQWVNHTWKAQAQKQSPEHQILSELGIPQQNLEFSPFRLQKIQPVATDDPQLDANPDPVGRGVEIYTPDDIYQSIELIGERVRQLFAENAKNAAILVRENRQGRFVAQQLAFLQREHDIRVYEVGEVERHSHIPAEILKLLQFLDRPHSPDYLKAALEVLEKRQLIVAQDLNALATAPEQFLYPGPLAPPQKPQVEQARRYCCNLLRARIELPHYQLITFLGMTLQFTGSELATVQKLAERVNQQIVGNSSLKTTLAVLHEIVDSERFEGVEEDNDDQYTRSSQLTIITMHKAKGLDWDYVFIPFLHDDVLPGQPWVPNAAKFLGDFTLADVARAQIRLAVHSQHQHQDIPLPSPTQAWKEAEQLKKAEEFRLLYVAMTRAKRLLWLSAAHQGPFRWSLFRGDGSDNLQPKKPCPVIPALMRQFPQSVQ
ncbi:MAG: ATP-dependent helicase [Cyanophyceae cyanobacterium]